MSNFTSHSHESSPTAEIIDAENDLNQEVEQMQEVMQFACQKLFSNWFCSYLKFAEYIQREDLRKEDFENLKLLRQRLRQALEKIVEARELMPSDVSILYRSQPDQYIEELRVMLRLLDTRLVISELDDTRLGFENMFSLITQRCQELDNLEL